MKRRITKAITVSLAAIGFVSVCRTTYVIWATIVAWRHNKESLRAMSEIWRKASNG